MKNLINVSLLSCLLFAGSSFAQQDSTESEYEPVDLNMVEQCEQEAKQANLKEDEIDAYIDDCVYESEENQEDETTEATDSVDE